MDKINEVDRKIIYEISEDARESHNKLAKKLYISREVFDYRLKKLQEKGIITNYQARINISNFIYGGYIILIQTISLTKESEKKVLEKVKQNTKTQYIGRLGGDYDFIIGFNVKNINELSEYIEDINNIFGSYKLKSSLLTMVKEIKDSFKSLFSNKSEENNIISMPSIDKKIEIDEIGRKILVMLGNDCTISSWQIAEKVKLTDVAIRKRIQKLIDSGIILGFRTMINLPNIGYQINNIFLRINPKNSKSEKELQKFFQSDKKITYSTKIIGEYDYIFTVLTNDNLELKEYLSSLRDRFSDTIMLVLGG